MIIRSLLANELKDTHSVMYELRGNRVVVRFANSMVQLFKPDFQPFGTLSDEQITFDLFVEYDRIAEHLARIGQENGQSKLHFVCEPFLIEKPINGFSLEVETAGIEKLTVLQADGKTVAAQQKVATTKQKLSIPVSTVGSALGNSHITIVGKTAGKQVLKTIRNINIGLNVDLDTEFDSDFLYLSVKSSGGVEDFLISSESRYDTKTFNGISGREMLFEGTFPFTTKSKKFSVALKFTSNDIFEFTGVTINSFTVSAA
ncbi:hypothetical protein BASA81_013695 [Batrachochytrium salamandrivorans]|nr:hypothetical protein BASA81_013695 [Batrachochytrium salamandrivorans]